MSSTFKWAMLGDLQIPYHDKRAVSLVMKVLKHWKPDAIDYVGDIDDQLEYSTFSDGTTDEFMSQLTKNEKENLKRLEAHEKSEYMLDTFHIPYDPLPVNPLPMIKENAQGAKDFYTDMRQAHPNADHHASLGNHDIRIFKYVNKKAPDYIDQVTPNSLWGLDDLGITWRHYDDPPLERFAGVHVHHGVTTTDTGLAVRNDILNYGISLVRGHDHRGGTAYKRYPLPGRDIVGLGTGHLCDPSAYGLKYTINPSWELGFGIGHVYKEASGKEMAALDFIRITPEYTCVVDGRVYKG